ncbi:DNA-binding transcriptional regulator, LysR family [Dyadobacter psychrophilus]|uniref:DNA-binding transcriptional regulator, LysR family n=2 Tax=Dyadobacter psychrophilus TaxID=651661 RepID=A0A1T5GZT4_9BACT|nr:DNA-binding transcriptional regulator, LysR family [Dyadobacter psychrophilus]
MVCFFFTDKKFPNCRFSGDQLKAGSPAMDMLSFRHEVFFEVASLLSFTKAGQVLNLSQPAISKHIKALEDNYKTSLFERFGNGIRLTDAGRILFTHLREASAIKNRLEFELSTNVDEFNAKGELRLGASTTVTLYIIPEILSAFRRQYPNVRISLMNRNSENVLAALGNNVIDLGIIEGQTKTTSANYRYFLSDEVILVCSPKSELWLRESISLDELRNYPVALRERGSGTLASIKSALESKKFKISDLNSNISLGGTEALKNFLLVDDCLGFLPLRSVQKELAAGTLKQVFVESLQIKRRFYFIQRHGTENNPFAQAFVRFALQAHNITL